MHLVVMQVVLWNAPDFFSIFSVIFVSDALVESRGPDCQKNIALMMPKSLIFALFYSVSLTSTYCLKTPKSMQIKILKLSPPPKPPPSKTYRGETQSDIHRFPSSAWPPPRPPPFPFGNTSKRYSAFHHKRYSAFRHPRVFILNSNETVACLFSTSQFLQTAQILRA